MLKWQRASHSCNLLSLFFSIGRERAIVVGDDQLMRRRTGGITALLEPVEQAFVGQQALDEDLASIPLSRTHIRRIGAAVPDERVVRRNGAFIFHPLRPLRNFAGAHGKPAAKRACGEYRQHE